MAATDQQRNQRTMVFSRRRQKKTDEEPFEPPAILPIATMDDLEAQVDTLLATYLHNVHTELLHTQVAKVIQQCPQDLPVITEKTINSFKILSRLHGLPHVMTPHLLAPLSDPSADVQFRLKIAHTLKYCQEKSNKFVDGAQVLRILEELEKNLGDSPPSFLERNLLSSLVQIVAIVVGQYDEATMTLLRRTFGMLNAEQKMDVRSLWESKGMWDAPLHAAGDASMSFIGSEMSEDSEDMKFLSQNLKRSNLTTVTKDQQIDTVISEETEKSEMLSFNIQCAPWTTQEETSSFNVRLEMSDAPQLPPANRKSSFWENVGRKVTFPLNNVKQFYQRAQLNQNSLTLEELEYIVQTFYYPTFFGKAEQELDKMIVDTLKVISAGVQLPETLVKTLLDKASDMYKDHEKPRLPLDLSRDAIVYPQNFKDHLLESILEVAGNQCVLMSAQKFHLISSRLKNIEHHVCSSIRVSDEDRGRLREKIWTIFLHQASENDMPRVVKDALDLLMDDLPHVAALDFIVTRVRAKKLSTIEQGVVPAAISVLKNTKYCQDQRLSAFQILQLHNSNPNAPLLTSSQLINTLEGLEDWAWAVIPPFILRYLNKNPPGGELNFQALNEIWRVLRACTDQLDNDLQNEAHLLLSVEKMASFTSEYRENNRHISIATLSAGNLLRIAQSLNIKRVINQDGSVVNTRKSSGDQPHMLFSTIAAKILVDLCPTRAVNSEIVAQVSQTLNDDDEDKMTRIYCSEYLFKMRKCHQFNLQELEVLQSCTQDPISDIRVYSRVAYTHSLKYMKVIPVHHVYHLPLVYAFAPVRFGCHDFTDEINNNILSAFEQVRDAVEFNVDMCKVLSHALDEMLQNPSEKLEGIRRILLTVEGSLRNMDIKDNRNEDLLGTVVDLIEKVFIQLDNLNDYCCFLMLKLLAEGQWISAAIAKKCVEITRAMDVANDCIHCLWIAAELQDLPERIFKDFHVESVGKRFSKVHQLPELNHHKEALKFLHKELESGHFHSEYNMQVIKDFCFTETLTELALDCLISACNNGQHIKSDLLDVAFNAACSKKKLKLAKILVQRHEQLPEEYKTALFYENFRCLSAPHDWPLLDLVVTMIQYNYWIPRFVINDFDAIAMAAIQTVGNPEMLPTTLVIPALACLMDRKLIYETRLPKWRDELLQYAGRSPSNLDLALDVILKLPADLISNFDIDALIIQALNPSAPQSSRCKLYQAQRGSSLHQMLLLFTRPDDIDDLTSAICLYIVNQIQLELPQDVCCRLEDNMLSSYQMSFHICDHLQALPEESSKHQLNKVADVAFLVQLSTNYDEIQENCNRIIQVLNEFGIKPAFDTNEEPEAIVVDSEDEGRAEQIYFSTAKGYDLEITWKSLSQFMECQPIQLRHLDELAMKVIKNSRNFSPSQIQAFIKFSFQASQDQEPTVELVKLWYHFLRYEPSPDVRSMAFSALAATRKLQGSDVARFIDQHLWDHIVKDKIRLLYKDIQGNEVHVSDHEFYTQLAHTLYSLDHWDFKQLESFTNPDDWIPQLIISDLIERFANQDKERAELYFNINKFRQGGGDLNSLKTFVCLNSAAAAKDFKMSFSTLIQLCNDCLQLTGAFKNQTLRSLIQLALSEKIESKFLTLQPSKLTTFLADQLLETVNYNYNVASDLISAIQSIQRPEELFQIIQLFQEMTSEQKEKCLDYLRTSEQSHSASYLRAAALTHKLMHILNADSTSDQVRSVEQNLKNLFKREFSPEPLLKLFNAGGQQKIPFDVLENIVHQLHQFNIDCHTFSSHLDQVMNSDSVESLAVQVSKLIQKQIHSDSLCERVRDIGQLLNELRHPQKNPNARLPGALEPVMEGLMGESSEYAEVRSWSREQICRWAQQRGHHASILEQVATICHAFKIHKDWNLTPVQILSILIALAKSTDRIQLQQVSTGTGKSAIIAAVAVVRALRRQKVDIYTSSPVLAERDAKEWTPFYAIFGLTCSHNIEKGGGGYLKGTKKCYEANIVYGDMSQFQFDALKTFYSGLETRGDRQFGVALVDEVDSMCIDDSSKLARLSSTLPGMDLLHIVYQDIWHQLRLINSRMMLVDGKFHFINSQEQTEEVEDLEKFVKKKLMDFINASVVNPTEGFKLPTHLRNYAKIQAENWADSAITALEFKENEHYIVDEGKIKPVDFMTTGVVQSSTNWNNGLHPFLQIKHSLRVTPETVTTNFMSNRELLCRYGSNVIGFTGTLGSQKSKEVLLQAYNAESVIIPEMYYKRFKRLGDIVASSREEWTSQIVYNALHEASKKRGVLVICQTIREARHIANEIRRANIISPNPEIHLSVYVRNDRSQENGVERVHPGTIIVATNLGTRGMDLKASDVEENGGLHVILTYLPDSLRVEEQAFGRTSRQGNRGTGQLIMIGNSMEISEQISDVRDIREGERLENFVTQELPLIKLKDQLFTKFCNRYSEIRKSLRQDSLLPSWTTGLRRITGFDSLSQHDYAVLQAIEERWALFLKKIEDDARTFDVTETGSFQEYEERATKDYQRLEATFLKNYRDLLTTFGSVENCFYWIRCGNELYQRDGKFSQSAAQSMKYFDMAAQYDGPIAPALVGKAVSKLKKSDHTWQHKEESLKNLEQAQRGLNQEILQYRRCQVLQMGRPGCANSDLHKQLENKIQLVYSYLFNVTKLIDAISKSLRRVHLTVRTDEADSCTTILHPGTEIPTIGQPSSNIYAFKFHDLTVRMDMSTIDQAIRTIDEACSYENICPSVSFTIKICPEFLLDDFKEDLNDLTIFINNLVDFSGLEYVHSCTRAKRMTLNITGTAAVVSHAFSLPIFANKNVELSYELHEQDGRWCKTSKIFTVVHGVVLNLNCEKISVNFDAILTERGLEDLFTIPHLSYSVKIVHLDIEKLNGGGWNSLLNRFDEIFVTLKTSDRSKANLMVDKLRKQNLNFVLEFSGLKYLHAKYLWENCDCSQELMTQQRLNLLSKRLPDSDLGPMISRGMELLPQFVEQNFVPWKSLIAMGAIGGGQLALGLALSSTVVGAQAGLGLISEGISDLIMAAIDGRDFEWKEYGKRKAISMTLSVTTLGSKGLMNGLKGLKSLALGAEERIATTAAKKGIGAGKNLSSLFTMTTKDALAQATTAVACRQLSQAYSSLSKFSFEQIRQHLFLKVVEHVQWEMQGICEDLARFFALESMRGSSPLKKLKNWISKIPKSDSHIIMSAITAGQDLCNTLQKFYTSEHLDTAATCFKLMSVAVVAIGGLTAILRSVKCICQYVHSCINKEISQLSIPTILSFTMTKQEAERATELLTFTDPPDFDVLDISQVNAQMSAQAFSLFEKITVEREKYYNWKGTFSGDSEEKEKFVAEIAEYVTSFIIKTANESLWSPESQDRLVKKVLEDAAKFAAKVFQDEKNPSENTSGDAATTVNQEMTDDNAGHSNAPAAEKVEKEVAGPAGLMNEGSIARDVEMENATKWVKSRRPRKASKFLRKF